MPHNHSRPRSSFGFTLLEMLLTLSLCVVLMILVSEAMTFYVREMATAETMFRQSQVASAVLQMIEDDLRMTLTTKPVDTTPLADVLASASAPLADLGLTSSFGGEESGDDDLPEDPEASGSTDLASDTSEEEAVGTEMLDVSLGGTVLQSPGLIGNSLQLQVDVSRLPRLEQSVIDPTLAVSGGNLLDRPSDIKTISYFVQAEGSGTSLDALEELAAASGIPASGASGGGLVRRELDRAINTYASTTGGVSRLNSVGELISPEVTAIEFEYYDGINWLTYYSSDEMGYLPLAVRVTLQIGGDELDPEAMRTFTHVIFLPMSHPEDADTEEDELSATTF
ncbi:type II secretion system protein GspJ [Aporhodopirellula aestuarii]|uniref:Type II secretion system protein GspJ n=1 Tax=Aporhodopirellula aestuarii TaxID=2950107 RepID=A0ABT0U462_9BACT|nr:type II secretion system protein GspJ [Aporhodopirellula aestuarii]MCM2371642.1 type II secretion system protein GspJ [Aporhodopirellula aestuarii]